MTTLPDALAAVAAMDAANERESNADHYARKRISEDAGIACIAYVRTLAQPEAVGGDGAVAQVGYAPDEINTNGHMKMAYLIGDKGAALDVGTLLYTAQPPAPALSAEEVEALVRWEARIGPVPDEEDFRMWRELRAICQALRRLSGPTANPQGVDDAMAVREALIKLLAALNLRHPDAGDAVDLAERHAGKVLALTAALTHKDKSK